MHMKGLAVDIAKPQDMNMLDFARAARQFFDKVLVYHDQNFIHCHNEMDE